MYTRRSFLKNLMLAGGFCLMPLGHRGWALASPDPAQNHLVVIMMRGAVDGLSIVTPFRENYYYAARPSIAIAPPGNTNGLLNLDGFFGLHPALAPVMPFWQNGTLAFVQASGSPAETRSHFEAQDIMETAMLNSAMARQGWMNGLDRALPDNHSPTQALSFGDRLPKIFQGPANIATIPNGMKGGGRADPQMDAQFGRLYTGATPLGALYQQAVSAHNEEMQDLDQEMQNANNGAPGTDAFVAQSAKAGAMIRRDPKIQLVFMDVGGWDTHVGQGNANGQLANRLGKLGEALAALAQSLGPEYQNTAILVMSEFGRTVAQNGNNGTDHGHGNVAWLMGGAVRGGKVYGEWPGLNRNQLWEGRDLAVTTDFRAVIGATLAGQFGLGDQQLAQLLPGYKADINLRGLIV